MDLPAAISNQTHVSLTLAKHVIFTEARVKNLVFSPLSLQVVLGLIAAGAGGPIRDQLLGFLKSNSVEDLNFLSSQLVRLLFVGWELPGGPKLSSVNGVWVDQRLRLKDSFKDVVENVYMAVSDHVDFKTKAAEVTREVNAWVDKETNGLIKSVLPPGSVDDATRLIFANAVYFKGSWNEEFDVSKTKDDTFFLLDGSSIQVPFMTSKKEQYVLGFDGFKVLGLPYKQGEDKRKFSMYMFLPDAIAGLPALVEKLSSEPGFIEHHLPYIKMGVGDFRIPKFKIEFGFEASDVLKGLGLVLPFCEEGGGLTEMVDYNVVSEEEELYVSSILHKSFIEVNEEGTEAAAASVARIRAVKGKMMYAYTLDFVADHPFAFVIREDATGVVLFVGQVLKP